MQMLDQRCGKPSTEKAIHRTRQSWMGRKWRGRRRRVVWLEIIMTEIGGFQMIELEYFILKAKKKSWKMFRPGQQRILKLLIGSIIMIYNEIYVQRRVKEFICNSCRFIIISVLNKMFPRVVKVIDSDGTIGVSLSFISSIKIEQVITQTLYVLVSFNYMFVFSSLFPPIEATFFNNFFCLSCFIIAQNW